MVDNFDDLLDLTQDDSVVPEQSENPDLVRIRELEALVSAPMPSFEEPQAPKEAPVEDRTPEQIRIKELEDQLARRNAAILENSPPQYETPSGDGERIVIHFLADGFVALGETWYRGQELEFVVGNDAYKRTMDRNGDTWLSLAGDMNGQLARYGQYYFGLGPFVPRPGEKFDDELAARDAHRNRAVPLPRL